MKAKTNESRIHVFYKKGFRYKQRLLHLYKLGNLWSDIVDLYGFVVTWDKFYKYQEITATCINLNYVYSHLGVISILHFVFKNLAEKRKQKEAYLI